MQIWHRIRCAEADNAMSIRSQGNYPQTAFRSDNLSILTKEIQSISLTRTVFLFIKGAIDLFERTSEKINSQLSVCKHKRHTWS
jgi:hypothetical protein